MQVPLLDASGSAIALVNAASPGSPPATNFTYDPSGNTTVSGSANSWPFEYRGMEHEITDPANLYFLPSSNVYNPRMQAALSQVGPQGLSGPGGGPAGNAEMPPSGTSGGLTWQSYQNDLSQSEQVGASTFVVGSFITLGEAPIAAPLAAIAYAVDFLVNFFEDIFGGSSSPPIPRQLMHRRHPLYAQILGISSGLVSTEAPAVRPGTVPLRSPDFYTVEVNAGAAVGVSVDFSVDRYGRRYLGIGPEVGKSLSIVAPNATAGWLNQRTAPSPAELHDFLTGNSFNAGGGYGIGAEETWTPGVGTATQLGAFSPQVGAAYHYGFELP